MCVWGTDEQGTQDILPWNLVSVDMIMQNRGVRNHVSVCLRACLHVLVLEYNWRFCRFIIARGRKRMYGSVQCPLHMIWRCQVARRFHSINILVVWLTWSGCRSCEPNMQCIFYQEQSMCDVRVEGGRLGIEIGWNSSFIIGFQMDGLLHFVLRVDAGRSRWRWKCEMWN